MDIKARILEEFEKVQKATHCIISPYEFASIIATFPAILVAVCDGTVDKDEKRFLLEISYQMTPEDVPESEMNLFAAEIYGILIYILSKIPEVKDTYLSILKADLSLEPSGKVLISEMLDGIASCSNSISQIEKDTIQEIKKILDIQEDFNGSRH
jgi:uncharacterized tellurite resistance protein B-like protein